MSIYVIAEAGVNHNGSVELAKKLIEAAAEAGADCVKFQTFKASALVSADAPKAEYQNRNDQSSENQLEMLQKLELNFDDFAELKVYCGEKGIDFLSTPFDLESLRFLDELGIPFWKVPSGEVTNYPYLAAIGQTKRPVVMSTGMCNLKEIGDAVRVLKENGTTEISILHCNTEYPTPFEDVNLKAMHSIRETFHTRVGYSDHTRGIEVPIAAAALGAEIIEKHFTLDRSMEGPDHKSSLEPDELKAMVCAIRNVELCLGDGIKRPSPSEIGNIPVARKSIVAACQIRKGEVFTEKNLTAKRPGTGISPMKWPDIIGRTADRDYIKDERIEI